MVATKATDKGSRTPPPVPEPGLFDYFGSFPVWMLKIIQLITPDFLIKKPKQDNPPKK